MKLELTYSKGTMGEWPCVTLADAHDNTVLLCNLTDAGQIVWKNAHAALILAGYSIYKDGKCLSGSLGEMTAE